MMIALVVFLALVIIGCAFLWYELSHPSTFDEDEWLRDHPEVFKR